MAYVFDPIETPSVAVTGTDQRFPVRRIFCVGRNYAEHALEMGGDPDREPPFFFTKPADAVVESGTTIPFPKSTNDLHHEVELVVAIGKEGENIPVKKALDHVFGYAVGIDLTRRDLQKQAKEKGRPWDSGKAFDQSAPCGAISPRSEIENISTAKIWLTVNEESRQSATIADLIWSIEEVIAVLSEAFILKPGDLIYTGTPAGVGPLFLGDHVTGHVDGLTPIDVKLTS
ncbi:fumarylacetoacetate hydrolase family protein [Sneathiella sp.]|uniref:fumarylacetoacetate hydrolase family protein n=1 Tax=Sneathiella sp. TaxID=1964365 RepID=UPI002609D760|nr:fumarylacetoacetate hydrolase family protein [Sneathiella sp.]MDF2365702.1 fumarylacetoacetate hydrolase family protein [Sneathiella sp.]